MCTLAPTKAFKQERSLLLVVVRAVNEREMFMRKRHGSLATLPLAKAGSLEMSSSSEEIIQYLSIHRAEYIGPRQDACLYVQSFLRVRYTACGFTSLWSRQAHAPKRAFSIELAAPQLASCNISPAGITSIEVPLQIPTSPRPSPNTSHIWDLEVDFLSCFSFDIERCFTMRVTPLIALGAAILVRAQDDVEDAASSASSAAASVAESVTSSAADLPTFTVSEL